MNEHFLVKVLKELDSSIERDGGQFDIVKDSIVGVRYSNYSTIIDVLDKYFSTSHFQCKLRSNFDIKSILDETKIITNFNSQVVQILEVLLLVAYAGHKGPSHIKYFDETSYIFSFWQESVERFMIGGGNKYSDEEGDSPNASKFNNSMQHARENLINEKNTLFELTITQDYEIEKLKDKNHKLELEIDNLNRKLMEYETKSETLNKESINEIQELWLKSKLENTKLREEIEECKLESSNLENTIKFNQEVHEAELNKYLNKIEILEDKCTEFNALKKQNEKLSQKIKEIQNLNNKQEIVDNLKIGNERVDFLLKEKDELLESLNSLKKELKKEKERNRELEYEKKKNDIEKQLNFNVSHANFLEQRKVSQMGLMEAINQKPEEGGDDSFILEMVGPTSSCSNFNFLKQLDSCKENNISPEDRLEYLKINRQQIEEIHRLTEEKENFIKERDQFETKLEKTIEEKEKIALSRERLELKLSKLELDNQKLEIEIEKLKVLEFSNDKLESNRKTEIEELKDKINSLRKEVKSLTESNTKLQKENQVLIVSAHSKRNVSNSNLFKGGNKESFVGNGSVPNTLKESVVKEDTSILRMESERLKKDLKLLKETSLQQEKTIKKLEDQVKDQDSKIQSLSSKDEVFLYKKKYEDLKSNIEKEHEVISNNIYDIALQFMGMKVEFQKRLESNLNKK